MDINWFKDEIHPIIEQNYKLTYSFFKNGDFGDLNRVEFEGNEKGGNIDFWSSGWLNIHLVDYEKGNELLNVLVEPQQEMEKNEAFIKLKRLLDCIP